MYLPLAALISLIVIGGWSIAGEALSRVPGAARLPTPARRGLAIALLALAAVSCAVATHARNQDYTAEERIWRDTVDKQPGNSRARIAYGEALAVAGRFADAESHLRRAIELDPQYPMALTRLGSVVAEYADWDQRREFESAAAIYLASRPDTAAVTYSEIATTAEALASAVPLVSWAWIALSMATTSRIFPLGTTVNTFR